jgi:hypothetical protein
MCIRDSIHHSAKHRQAGPGSKAKTLREIFFKQLDHPHWLAHIDLGSNKTLKDHNQQHGNTC